MVSDPDARRECDVELVVIGRLIESAESLEALDQVANWLKQETESGYEYTKNRSVMATLRGLWKAKRSELK